MYHVSSVWRQPRGVVDSGGAFIANGNTPKSGAANRGAGMGVTQEETNGKTVVQCSGAEV